MPWLKRAIANTPQDDTSEFENELSDITSLSSSVLDYEYENGRRYHSNRAVSYIYICIETRGDVNVNRAYTCNSTFLIMKDKN